MEKNDSLESIAVALLEDVKTRNPPRIVEGVMTAELHERAPFLPKARWTSLGDKIKLAEMPTVSSIPGGQWISLRCDGTGFSRFLPKLRAKGIIKESGFSEDFATIMQDCSQTLMEKFGAVCGFTQSDEMTILVAPTHVVSGVQQPHPYNGRVQKLCSLAAATVTARFNYGLMQLCKDQVLPVDALATFDCRVGAYDTKEEAVSLLLWRAYDSGTNGVADAVHAKKGEPGRKEVMKLPTGEKLQWLMNKNFLPLPRHQREGTYYVKRKRVLHTTNRATGEPVICLRSRVEHIPGNVIRLYKDDKLFPPDETLSDVPLDFDLWPKSN